MALDYILMKIGPFGAFQRRVVFLLCLVAVSEVLQKWGYIFWTATPDFKCHLPPKYKAFAASYNLSQEELLNVVTPTEMDSDGTNRSRCFLHDLYTVVPSAANRSTTGSLEWTELGVSVSNDTPRLTACSTWFYYMTSRSNSLVSQWDLVCDRSWLVPRIPQVYTVGQMVGSLLFGVIADTLGRRRVLLFCTVAQVVLGITVAFAPEIYSLLGLRCLLAAVTAGQFNTAFIIVLEVAGQSWRVVTAVIILVSSALSFLLLAAVASIIHRFVLLQLVSSAPFVALLVYVRLVPESPRWMMIQNRDQGIHLVKKVAACNGVELEDDFVFFPDESDCKPRNPFLLLRLPAMRKKTLALLYLWLTTNLVDSALGRGVEQVVPGVIATLLFKSGMAAVACLVCLVAFHKLGRRFPLSFTLTLVGVCLQCTVPVPPELNGFTKGLVLLARFCLTIALVMVQIFTVELLPTVARATGLGACVAAGCLGTLFVPLTVHLTMFHEALPYMVQGGLALLGALVVLSLPDTRKEPLPDSFSDAENFAKKNNLLCFVIEDPSPVKALPRRRAMSQIIERPVPTEFMHRLSVPGPSPPGHARRKYERDSWDFLLSSAAL